MRSWKKWTLWLLVPVAAVMVIVAFYSGRNKPAETQAQEAAVADSKSAEPQGWATKRGPSEREMARGVVESYMRSPGRSSREESSGSSDAFDRLREIQSRLDKAEGVVRPSVSDSEEPSPAVRQVSAVEEQMRKNAAAEVEEQRARLRDRIESLKDQIRLKDEQVLSMQGFVDDLGCKDPGTMAWRRSRLRQLQEELKVLKDRLSEAQLELIR